MTYSPGYAADLILVNGKVVTIDSKFSIAQAIALKGDRIAAVGSNKEIKALAGRGTRVIDLGGNTALPGINDAHTHAALFGGTRPPLSLDVGYSAVKSIKDIVTRVAEKVKTVARGEWVRGVGWDDGYLEECLKQPGRKPNRWDLDPVSKDNPVCLGDYSVHELWVNSKALQIAGITGDTPNPAGGEIVRDPETGEATGLLRELPAEGLIMKVVPQWSKAQKRDAILAMMKEFNSLGITSITEAALGPGGTGYQGGLLDAECISIYNDLFNEGKLTLRVGFFYLFGEYGSCSLKDFQGIVPLIGIHSGFGNEWLRLAGLKIFADGIPSTKTAWMSEEYLTGGYGSLCLPGKNR